MAGTYINLPQAGGSGTNFISSIANSDSVDLTVSVGLLTADVKISTNPASSGFFKATTTIQSTGSTGLHVELPIATTLLTGVISAADWNTFNNKQDFITAGTTSQYYRGDKTFQTLEVAALVPVTDGSLAATGAIGEILTASQVTPTATGVAASGGFGAVVSLSLTAGAYYVYGVVGFTQNGADLTGGLECGISASATGAGLNEFDTQFANSLISGAADLLLATPPIMVNIASTTTYYLNSRFIYSAGSPQHRGKITAWRIR